MSALDQYFTPSEQAAIAAGQLSMADVERRLAAGTPAPQPTMPEVRDASNRQRMDAYAQRFNDAPRDAYGQRIGISARDTDAYCSSRFVEHMKERIGFWAALTNSSYRGQR